MYKMDVNLTKKLMKSQCSLLIYIHVVVSYKLTTFKVKCVKIYIMHTIILVQNCLIDFHDY